MWTCWKSLLCLTYLLGWLKTQKATGTVKKSWRLLLLNWGHLWLIRCSLHLSGNFSSSAAGPDSLTRLEPASLQWNGSAPFPPSSHDSRLFLKVALKNWSKRTYSLAPHTGKAINTLNTTFSRNHYSRKTVTPYERQDTLQAIVSRHIPALLTERAAVPISTTPIFMWLQSNVGQLPELTLHVATWAPALRMEQE